MKFAYFITLTPHIHEVVGSPKKITESVESCLRKGRQNFHVSFQRLDLPSPRLVIFEWDEIVEARSTNTLPELFNDVEKRVDRRLVGLAMAQYFREMK